MANYANVGNFGDPLSPGWQDQNLSWIEPIKGQRWQVNRRAQAAFEGLLGDLIKLGYHPTSSGGFNYRNIRGGNKLSQHAFGNAIDLNSMTNARGQSATDIPHAAELARKWGLEWGGNWKNNPDPMHFEWTGGGAEGNAGGAYPAASGGQFGPAMPKSITNYSPENRRNAIASIESAGSGDYGALGPMTGGDPDSRDRAYGRYQVMGKNIPAWTKQVLGRAMTPDEFLKNPQAQDAVFDKIFGDYVAKHGEEGAASMWFTGRPDAFDAKDALGTTGGGYIKKYMDALAGQTANGTTYNYPDQAPVDATGGAAGAGGPSVDQGGKKDDNKFDFDAFTASIGDMFGAGKGGGGRVGGGAFRSLMPASSMTTEGIQSATAMSPEQAQARLQLALARLNSGKLWG